MKALVTGASSGIGSAIAVALGHAGADVAINYSHDEPGANATVEVARRCGSQAMRVQGDVSRMAARLQLHQEFEQEGMKVAPPRLVYTSRRGRKSLLHNRPRRKF